MRKIACCYINPETQESCKEEAVFHLTDLDNEDIYGNYTYSCCKHVDPMRYPNTGIYVLKSIIRENDDDQVSNE